MLTAVGLTNSFVAITLGGTYLYNKSVSSIKSISQQKKVAKLIMDIVAYRICIINYTSRLIISEKLRSLGLDFLLEIWNFDCKFGNPK